MGLVAVRLSGLRPSEGDRFMEMHVSIGPHVSFACFAFTSLNFKSITKRLCACIAATHSTHAAVSRFAPRGRGPILGLQIAQYDFLGAHTL